MSDPFDRPDQLELAHILHGRIPGDAVVIRDADLLALAWPEPFSLPDRQGRLSLNVLSAQGGGARLSQLTAVPDADAVASALADPGTDAKARPTNEILRHPRGLGQGLPEGDRLAVLSAFAGLVDSRAYVALERARVHGPACRRFVASHHRGADAVRRFAAEHPWLLAAAAETEDLADGIRGIAVLAGPDLAAATVLRRLAGGDHPGIPGLVGAMRGFVLPLSVCGPATAHHVMALLHFTPDMFPPSPVLGLDPDGPEQQGHLALYTLAPTVVALSRITRRQPRSVVGRTNDWAALAQTLSRRGGIEEAPEDFPGEWGCILPGDAMREVADMAVHFAYQVLSPALRLRDGTAPAQAVRTRDIALMEFDALGAASVRILAGERTLPAIAETCRRWHARADAIARHLAGLMGPDAPSGPRLFDDLDVEPSIYMTCINTVCGLLDEGSPDRDRAGALGLDHCVGGYGLAVVEASTAVVGLRRRLPEGGYERLSTAEVDFRCTGANDVPTVIQHMARGNTHPGDHLTDCLMSALAVVRDRARTRIMAHVVPESSLPNPSVTIRTPADWADVRDLWAFALPRPLRSLGPADLLDAAGLGEPVRPPAS